MRRIVIAIVLAAGLLAGCSAASTHSVIGRIHRVLQRCSYFQPVSYNGEIVIAVDTGSFCTNGTFANLLISYTGDRKAPWISTLIISGGEEIAQMTANNNTLRIYRIGRSKAVSQAAGYLADHFQEHGWRPEVPTRPTF